MSTDDQGILIEEFVDLDGELGVHYQKCGEGYAAPRAVGRPLLFFARCSSVFEVRNPEDSAGTVLDAYRLAIVPATAAIRLRGVTAVADFVAFFPSAKLLAEVEKTFAVEAGRLV